MRYAATLVAVAVLAGVAAARVSTRQGQTDLLRQSEAPANGIWVDSLDMSRVSATVIRTPRGRGAGPRGAEPGAPPPPVYALGGIVYPHTVPMQSDRDLSIDLKG